MLKTSLISLLKQLSPEEIREADAFVRSPFFNSNKSVVKLFGYLKKQYPNFEPIYIEKKYVFRKIFGKAYNDGIMRVLISNLTGLVEEYLKQINLRNRQIAGKIALLNELNLRKRGKEIRTLKKEIEKLFASEKQMTMHDFFQKGMFEDNIYFYNNWSRLGKKRNIRLDEASLKSIIDNFTRFYLIASFTMYRKVLFVKAHEKIEIDLKFVEDVLKILEEHLNDFTDTPLISLYTNEVLLLTKGDKKYFDILKDEYINHPEKFHIMELYSLLKILQRYGTNQILKGNLNFEQEKFLLYRSAALRGNIMFPVIKMIEDSMFISIVTSALAVGELSWAEDFLNGHKHLISDQQRQVLVEFCNAKLDIEKGLFERALARLQNIKTKNTETQLYIKTALLKTYYELAMYNEADLAVDSLRHLLPKAEKNMAIHIFESYKNFLKYFTTLIKIKEKNKKEKLARFLKEFNSNKSVAEYKWLKQKTAELEK